MKNTKKYKNNLLQKRQQLARLYEIMEQLGMVGGELEFPEHLNFVSVNNFVDDLCLYNDLPTIKKLLIAIIIEPFGKIKEGEKEDISSMATYNPDEEWVGLTSKEAFTLFLEETKREYDKYCDIIMRDLKVLDIIKNKDVDIVALRCCISLEQYNCKEDGRINLAEYEYNLLKEWIKDDER